MTLYMSRATSGREASPAEKLAGTLEAFEIDSLDELHPNVTDTIRRILLPMESDKLLYILITIEHGKDLSAAKGASESA